ncbi:MAG: hypothetical protein CL520_07920 [Actinobacteria bacterium]|nr:hypothetical protein [Actinomycetota bacterium]
MTRAGFVDLARGTRRGPQHGDHDVAEDTKGQVKRFTGAPTRTANVFKRSRKPLQMIPRVRWSHIADENRSADLIFQVLRP